ncbi:hypothetical protein [Myxosarcina sp. GI1]|uniref:hypothetical protein n=1 Tax=Myxosarcina sp. GI1 TaxID=1541065 RepID=UPI0005642E8E|nr:hypothetical protein [Myxosarcina sp. GI1]
MKQAFIFDILTAFWTVTIFFILFCWLPIKTSLSDEREFCASQIVGIWSRTMLVAIAGVLGLSFLHLLNWLTLTLLYCCFLFSNYLESHGRRSQEYALRVGQKWLLGLIDVLDSGISFETIKKTASKSWQSVKYGANNALEAVARQGMLVVLSIAVVLSFACLLRWQYPLLELRFSHPDSYGSLLTTRQILSGYYPDTARLPVFPTIAAAISLLGSIEPMQVIRFLGAILGILMVLSLGYCLRVMAKNTYATLVAMFALGAYLFTWELTIPEAFPESIASWGMAIIETLNASQIRQWTGSELELGVIFVLLSIGYYFNTAKRHRRKAIFWLNLLCALLLVALTSPILLVLAIAASIGLIGGRRLALTAVSIAWVVLGVLAAIPQGEFSWAKNFLLTLPVGFSLLIGLLFLAIAESVSFILGKWSEQFCLALACALAVNFLLPLPPKCTYLEYEITARKSLELTQFFPRQSWTLVGPAEQLAEIYGSGWYEDLAQFVEKYSSKAEQAEFNFPISGEHLFIYVEKVPFVTFATEPEILPNSILSDRTYRYYRSSAGRASLEYEALQMCEAYRHNHPQSEIYYENEELRIYHFVA